MDHNEDNNLFDQLIGSQNSNTASQYNQDIQQSEAKISDENQKIEDAKEILAENITQLFFEKLNPDDDPGPQSESEFYHSQININEAIRVQDGKTKLSNAKLKNAENELHFYKHSLELEAAGIFNPAREKKAIAAASQKREYAVLNESTVISLSVQIRNKMGCKVESEIDKICSATERSIKQWSKIIDQKELSREYIKWNKERIPLAVEVAQNEFNAETDKYNKLLSLKRIIDIKHSDFKKSGGQIPALTPAQKKYILIRDRNFKMVEHLRDQGFEINVSFDSGSFVGSIGGSTQQHKPRNKDLWDLLDVDRNIASDPYGEFAGDYNNKDNHFKPAQHKMN